VGLFVLAGPVLRLLWRGGEFGASAVAAAEYSLLFYVFSLIGLSGLQIVNRALYSLRDTRTPPLVGIGYTLLIVILAIALMRTRLQYAAIAAATSIGVTVGMVVLFEALRRQLNGIDGRAIAVSFARVTAASLVMAGIVLIVSRWLGGALGTPATQFLSAAPEVVSANQAGAARAGIWAVAVQVLASLAVGGVSYVVVLFAMGAPELATFREVVRRRRASAAPTQ